MTDTPITSVLAKPARRWVTIFRRLCFVAAILTAVFLGLWFREYLHSQAIKQRLIGKWTCEVIRQNGSVATCIWEFRADGTAREYLAGKPSPETGRLDDYLQWDVSDGELVLSWDHLFTREATVNQRLRQVVTLVDERLRGKDRVLKFADRCVIHDHGGNTISFTVQPGKAGTGGFLKKDFALTRVSNAQ